MGQVKSRIIELVEILEEADNAYHVIGEPMMKDPEYDELVKELRSLDSENEYFNKVGSEVPDGARKVKLPFAMKSLDKIYTMDELKDWLRLRMIPLDTIFCLTPKYDAISLLVNEQSSNDAGDKIAYTRGDSSFGQIMTAHLALADYGHKNVFHDMHTFGELIMPRSTFEQKYDKNNESLVFIPGDKDRKGFENPRNLVGGKANDDEPSFILKDTMYVRYGIHEDRQFKIHMQNKSKQLDFLNTINPVIVPYELVTLEDLSQEKFSALFSEWSEEFELDGIVIEIDEYRVRQMIGQERNGNPAYARAYKGGFESRAKTKVINITRQISKQGHLKPVVHIEPVRLNGVTVRKMFADNERFLYDYRIGIGSNLVVKRSGMVIPRICEVEGIQTLDAEVLNDLRDEVGENIQLVASKLGVTIESYEPPEEYGVSAGWNASKIELTLTNPDANETVRIQRMVAFFEILKVADVSDKTVEDFYNHGYDTIQKVVMDLTPPIMASWEGWGDKSAEIVYNNIHAKMSDIPLEKLQHASGLFQGLGSKKLVLLGHFTEKPRLEDIIAIDGFKDTLAIIFLNGWDKFQAFKNSLVPVVTVKSTVKAVEGPLTGVTFCFTEVRSKDCELKIASLGGKIATGVSKNLTYLVCLDKNGGSSKLKKARECGTKIINMDDLSDLLLSAKSK